MLFFFYFIGFTNPRRDKSVYFWSWGSCLLFIHHVLEFSTVKFRRPSGQRLRLCRSWSRSLKPVLSPHAHALPPQFHFPCAPAVPISFAFLLYRYGVCLVVVLNEINWTHLHVSYSKTFMRKTKTHEMKKG